LCNPLSSSAGKGQDGQCYRTGGYSRGASLSIAFNANLIGDCDLAPRERECQARACSRHSPFTRALTG
jgi:hypothetical protein